MDKYEKSVGGFAYPIQIIDYEASALTLNSYPIEVGFCSWHGPGHRPISWSSLIQPTDDWLINGDWDPDSARIHGLNRRDLHSGMAPDKVVAILNTSLTPSAPVLCDGGHYDAHWNAALFRAARTDPAFQLGDLWDGLRSDWALANAMADWLSAQPIVHRAEADTLRLMRGIMAVLGHEDDFPPS